MPTITVKNIPADVYDLLKQSATANRRSINSEIITCIEHGVRGRRINAEDLLMRARKLRRKTKHHPITEIAFRKAKLAGRP
ncbi:MAG TPA: Arc family DNA-binding protein [Candidatus Bipolaricaulota bacterium]